jgi:hypothetical protein
VTQQTTRFDFGANKTPQETFTLHEHIIEDRGSRYSASIGKVQGREDIKNFLKQLKADKKYAKATHNSWAARISHEGTIYETKADDGETGASVVILRVMQKEEVTDCVICVTRWFGGVKTSASLSPRQSRRGITRAESGVFASQGFGSAETLLCVHSSPPQSGRGILDGLVKLMGDRFKHLQDATIYAISNL